VTRQEPISNRLVQLTMTVLRAMVLTWCERFRESLVWIGSRVGLRRASRLDASQAQPSAWSVGPVELAAYSWRVIRSLAQPSSTGVTTRQDSSASSPRSTGQVAIEYVQ
jgi:hypothetical protein